ncbi:MAG TPA: tetratricopeptide repeat protein [Tepidisphaeraceae bacterium]
MVFPVLQPYRPAADDWAEELPMTIHPRRILMLATVGVLLAGSGCASDNKKTQKELAVAQWRAARAGVMHNLARDQFTTGNFDKARATCDEAISIDPESVPLHVLSARIAMEQNRLDAADKSLAEARRRNPKYPEALYLSGIVSQRWQKPEEALDYYTRAADAEPTELAYLMARAETLVQLARRPEALSALQDKVVYFEHSAAIRDAVGQLLLQEKRYADAIEFFRQASILAGDDWSIKERLAMAEMLHGDAADAAELLRAIVKRPEFQDRPDLHTALGEMELRLGRRVDARLSFQTATEADAASIPAWIGLTKAALSLNDFARAEIAAHKAVSLAPELSDTHLTLGYVRFRQQRYDEALVAFRRAAALNPEDATSLCMIGTIMAKQGRPGDAMVYFAKAIKADPSDELAKQMMLAATTD